MNPYFYHLPYRITFLLAIASLTAFLLLGAATALAQGASAQPARHSADDQRSASLETEDTSPVLPEERAHYEQKLREWEAEQDALFEELIAAVQASDRVETYYVLKRLHGGGADVDGSEFERFRAEVQERRQLLEKREAELRRMQAFEKAAQDYPQLRDRYQASLLTLKARVAKDRESIANLETDALKHAERSIVKELPMIFALLSGGSLEQSGADGEIDPLATDINR